MYCVLIKTHVPGTGVTIAVIDGFANSAAARLAAKEIESNWAYTTTLVFNKA